MWKLRPCLCALPSNIDSSKISRLLTLRTPSFGSNYHSEADLGSDYFGAEHNPLAERNKSLDLDPPEDSHQGNYLREFIREKKLREAARAKAMVLTEDASEARLGSDKTLNISSVVREVTVGHIRYDKENVKIITKSSIENQETETGANAQSDMEEEVDLSFIDEQYFTSSQAPKPPPVAAKGSLPDPTPVASGANLQDDLDLGFIDGQYFRSGRETDNKPISKFQEEHSKLSVKRGVGDSNAVVEHTTSDSKPTSGKRAAAPIPQPGLPFFASLQEERVVAPPELSADDMNFIDEQYFGDSDRVQGSAGDEFGKVGAPHATVPPVTVEAGGVTKAEARFERRRQLLAQRENSALGVALDIRRALRRDKMFAQGLSQYKDTVKNQGSEDGQIAYKDQVVNLERLDKEAVIKILLDNVLYNDHGVVALNKPYGIPVGGQSEPYRHSVARYLPQLAQELCREDAADVRKLRIVHRLDRNTTGALLLAKSAESAFILGEMFANRKIGKNYLAILKSRPEHSSATIDIPIAESSIRMGGKDFHRQRLVPIAESSVCHARSPTKGLEARAAPALTRYRVLDVSGSAALVLVTPITGVKHQIRCHLSHAIGCPVLGDHKYSSLTRIVPQRLAGDMLEKLHLRQGRVRDLPLHLHCSDVHLPEFIDGKHSIRIKARLPGHFMKNMKRLRLKIPFKMHTMHDHISK